MILLDKDCLPPDALLRQRVLEHIPRSPICQIDVFDLVAKLQLSRDKLTQLLRELADAGEITCRQDGDGIPCFNRTDNWGTP